MRRLARSRTCPATAIDLAARRDGAGLGGGSKEAASPSRAWAAPRAGCGAEPSVLPAWPQPQRINLLQTTDAVAGGLGGRECGGRRSAGRAMRRNPGSSRPPPHSGVNWMEVSNSRRWRRKPSGPAAGTIDSSHAVAQGALGVETLSQAQAVVGQNGPASLAGLRRPPRDQPGAQEQGVLIGRSAEQRRQRRSPERVHRGREAAWAGMRGGGRGRPPLHLAHAHGSTGGADGMPGF